MAIRDAIFLNLVKPLNPAICTVVNIEVIQGSKSKAEIKELESFIQDKFVLLANTGEDLRMALQLVRRHSSGSGILLGDAIIGATAINRNLSLFTFNTKHFRYPEIKPLLIEP